MVGFSNKYLGLESIYRFGGLVCDLIQSRYRLIVPLKVKLNSGLQYLKRFHLGVLVTHVHVSRVGGGLSDLCECL